ncbi:hypothetical protein KJ564_15635, partial [bacterium]|nr:hypothetical protein [bacterium]
MRYKSSFSHLVVLFITVALLTGSAVAQWGSAALEGISIGPENDEVGQSSLGIDDFGTLHLVFDRISGGDHNYYSTQKVYGYDWIDAVPLGDHSHVLSGFHQDVHKPAGIAYVVYLDNGLIKLATASDCTWLYYDLQTPYLEQLIDPAVAVDGSGNAHVAFVVYHGGLYKIGYGYWDNTADFHYQMLEG